MFINSKTKRKQRNMLEFFFDGFIVALPLEDIPGFKSQ